MAITGINLGATSSLTCVYRGGRAEPIPNELGEYKTSSSVSVLEDGAVPVGAAAKERLVTHPESAAASALGQGWKRDGRSAAAVRSALWTG